MHCFVLLIGWFTAYLVLIGKDAFHTRDNHLGSLNMLLITDVLLSIDSTVMNAMPKGQSTEPR